MIYEADVCAHAHADVDDDDDDDGCQLLSGSGPGPGTGIYGCLLRENMDISGTFVGTKLVKTTVECAKICSETESCDSFWCYTYPVSKGTVTKKCHLRRHGKYRKTPRKTAGICSKGRFSYFGDSDILQIIPAVG